ncbi:hypothetical protein [Microbispora bryophytorum]|uniref:Uncharacterized protein n=1 Tax=Microbispora bryophytorum TaxID=1460882 RepID=A0A8H9H1I5_9ACTN|nr:hypothetical protein [Microbispora bryophytorum]MBD3136493.1 hypothetical protein [Microbispora bryophytorum]TQS01658.1 hypothetical protein FLX07_31740 [Microbispora bryophytorum]GGO18689.1 hypothetical protein GCM10011574_43560 [Microbispora bryophytorum]
MAFDYPVRAEAAEENHCFEDLPTEWSEDWVIEVTPREVDEEADSAVIGPMSAKQAWDYVHELLELRPYWTYVPQPLYEPHPHYTRAR